MKKGKKMLKSGISAFLICGMLASSLADPLTGYTEAKAAEKKQQAQQELTLKEQLAATKDQFPNGAIGFMNTQLSVAEGGKTQIQVNRQGGTDTKATVTFKIVDVTADYGDDYEVSIKEGNRTTVLEASKGQQSLMEKYSDSVQVEEQPDAEETRDAEAEKETPQADAKAETVGMDDLTGIQKAAAMQNGTVGTQKSWREVEKEDNSADEYAKAEEITGKGEDALKDVLQGMEGVTYTLTFQKGEYKKVIDVAATDDKLSESDEQFMIMLVDAKGSELSASNTGYVNIKDNEDSEVNVFEMAQDSVSVNAGEDSVSLKVRRTSGVNQLAVMGVGTIEDTAKAGTDYEATTETLVFPPGVDEKTIAIPLKKNADRKEEVSFYVGATSNSDSVVDATAKATKVTIVAPKETKKADRSFGTVSTNESTTTYWENRQVAWSGNWNTATWRKGGLDLRNAKKLKVEFKSESGGREYKDGCKKKWDSQRVVSFSLSSGSKWKNFFWRNSSAPNNGTAEINLEGSGLQNKNVTLVADVDPTGQNDRAGLYISKITITYEDFYVEAVNVGLNDEGQVFNASNLYKEKRYTTSSRSTDIGNTNTLGSLKINNSTSSAMISSCSSALSISSSFNSNAKNSADIAPSPDNTEFKDIEMYDNSAGKWKKLGKKSVSAEDLLTTYREWATKDRKFRLRPVFAVKKVSVKFKNNTSGRQNKGSFNGFNNNSTFDKMTMLDTLDVSAAPKQGYAVSSINVSGKIKTVDNQRKDRHIFAPKQTSGIQIDVNYEEASVDVRVDPKNANGDKGSVLYYDSDNPSKSVDGDQKKNMKISGITLGKTYNIIGLSKPGYRAIWSDGTVDDNNDGILSQQEKERYKDHKSFSPVNGNVLQYVPQDPYSKIYYDFIVPTVVKDPKKQVSIVGKVFLDDVEIFSGEESHTPLNGVTVSVGETSSSSDTDAYSTMTKRLDRTNNYAKRGDGYFELKGNNTFYKNDYHLININYVTSDGSTMIASQVVNPANYTEVRLDTESVMAVEAASICYWDDKSKSWNDLKYNQVDNGDYKCKVSFDVNSLKTSVQPRKAVLRFYNESGGKLHELTCNVDAANAGAFSFEFNPKKLELPSGATATLQVFDQNNKGYYERKTGIVVKESIGLVDLINSFEFGGLNTAIKLVGKIDSAFDLGWNGGLDARTKSDNVDIADDGTITLSIGFAKDDLVDSSKSNKKSLKDLAEEKAEADQALLDEKAKKQPDQAKITELTKAADEASKAYDNQVKSASAPNGQKRSTEIAGNVKLSLEVRLSLTFAFDKQKNANYFDNMVLSVGVSGGAGVEVKFATPIGITIGLGFSVEGSGSAAFVISRKTDQEVNPKYYLTTVKDEKCVRDNAGKINLFSLGKGTDKAFNASGHFYLAPTITIKASAGFGDSIEISVSGSAAFNMDFHTDDKENNGMVNLSASIGIKVLFISASWPFVSKDVNLFGNSSSSSMDDLNYLHENSRILQASDREYLKNRGKWNTAEMSAKSLDENEQGVAESELLEGIYSGTDVKLMPINDSGDYLAVFVDDPGTEDALNGASVYYTIYNSASGKWDTPVLLEDDGTIDQDVAAFDLGARGIMVTWSSANRVFSDKDSRTSMMNAMDIHGKFFDKSTKKFGEVMNITKETQEVSADIGCDNVGDVAPSVVYNDKSMLVYYTKNQYSVSNEAEGEVVGDVVYPEMSLMAYRQYNFSGESGTDGTWVEDYALLNDKGAEKEYLVEALGEDGYQKYVDAWYGQMFFNTVPNVFVEEEIDENGYWKDNKEPKIYKGHTVQDDTTTSDGEDGGIVSGGTEVTGSDTVSETWSPKIIDSDAISYNNLGLFAFTGDYDQSMKTTGDRDVYIQLYDFETGSMTHPIIVSSNNVEDSDVHFVRAKYKGKAEDTGKEYTYEATYLTWLSNGNVVSMNVSNVIKNCLVKKDMSGEEYYIIDKSSEGNYEPIMTMVEGEVAEDNEGAISPISSFDVAANDGYIYVTWTQNGQTLKKGVEENTEEATKPENQNVETQVYMSRYDFAENCMTGAVQVTSGAGDNYDNMSFGVNKDGTVTALATKAGTKVVDAKEFNETIKDYNAAASEDEKMDEVTDKEFTKYAAVDAENKSLVAMQITPTSVLKVDKWNVDDLIAGENNNISVELLNDGIDTLKGATVTMTSGDKSILQELVVTDTETESVGEDKPVDSLTIDKIMGGERYLVSGTLALPDDANSAEIKVKVTDKSGTVLVEDTYKQEILSQVGVSNLKVEETDERDVYNVSFDVANSIFKASEATEVKVGITTKDGEEKLATVPVDALAKGEKRTYTETVEVDSAKQFIEGTDEDGYSTETGKFFAEISTGRDTFEVVRTVSNDQLTQITSITDGKIADGEAIKIGVGQTAPQSMNISSSLKDDEVDANGTEGLQVLWKSGDEEIAYVDANGNLTGMKEGTTSLKAYVLPKDSDNAVSMSEDNENTYNFGTSLSAYTSMPNKAIKVYTAEVNVTEQTQETPTPTPTPTPAEPTPTPGAPTMTPVPTATASATTTPAPKNESTAKTTTKKGVTYKVSGKAVVITKAAQAKGNVTIPSTVTVGGKKYAVTKIQANAFKNNKKLTSIVIGKNVTSIGKNAFYGCKKLKKVTFKGKKPPVIGAKAFKNIYKKAVFKVPAKSVVSKYKKKLTKKTGVTSKMKIKK